ncbi:hypothetical protein [uncultured Jatrophihabitans sp.]|uniref:hypothetical protein n=1 Tax=uncultured Jatrophihabitans sp. TaxID=1610747 RepID=UPI0035CA43AF
MSSLSAVPLHKRRQFAATLGLFAVLLIAVGAVAATGAHTAAMTAFVVVALVAGAVVAVLSWGVALSIRNDREAAHLDAAIADAVAEHSVPGGAAAGALACGCGHEHDPEELHVQGDPCAHDGHGDLCSRTCDTCVLGRLRSTATAETVPARPRPRPTR